MAMLAEPRRKKRYILTPKGKALYEDETRFGSKMLQKMGWTKGKGLGAKEHGSTDFVRVTFKNDAAGVGFTERDDQWTQHEHGFNGLLKSLQCDNGDEIDDHQTVGFGFQTVQKKNDVKESISGVSLEERSKQSKARVHYKKFTRGKDLSRYSEKDLANIFGKKALHIQEANAETDSGKFIATSTTIADYFNTKSKQRETCLASSESSKSEDITLGNSDEEEAEREVKKSKSENSFISTGTTVSDYFKEKMEKRKSGLNSVKDKKLKAAAIDSETPKKREKRKRKNSMPLCENELDTENVTKSQLPEVRKTDIIEIKLNPERIKKSKTKNANQNENLVAENNCTPSKNDDNEHADLEQTTVKVEKKKKKFKFSGESPIVMSVEKQAENASIVGIPTGVNTDSELASSQEKSAIATTSKQSESFAIKLVKPARRDWDGVDINERIESLNIYQISAFTAEKFRHVQFDKFNGSNLAQMVGYSFDNDLKISISKKQRDEDRITKFWNQSNNKYNGRKKKTPYNVTKPTTVPDLKESTQKPQKGKSNKRSYSLQKHKRKSAFKSI